MGARKILIGALFATLAVGCGKKGEDNNDHTEPDAAHETDSGSDAGPGEDASDPNDAGDAGDEIVPFSPDCTTTLGPGASAADNFATLQTALLDANDGDVLCFVDGTYDLEEELTLTVANVELRGQSKAGTIFDFAGQTAGANGISATSNGVTFADFTVRNTPGDGVRVTGADGVVFRNLNITWSGGPNETNGAYGIYPVQCQNVLVEGSTVSFASDAGIYVGQSQNVIVRNNEAFGNVAGIEIENTTGADVHDNHAHGNTGGLLIFDLPGPPVQGGKQNKIHNNIVENNNEPNFAAAGNIVALVPTGTGVLVIASDENEIADNTITGNQSIGIAIVSFQTTAQDFEFNPDFDPFSEGNWVHGNTLSDNGTVPAGFVASVATAGGVTEIEPLTWDGVVDPTKDDPEGNLVNCFSDNTDGGAPAEYRNYNSAGGFMNQTTELGDNACEHEPLPRTTLE